MFKFSLLIATPLAKIKNFGHLPLHRGGFSTYLVEGAYGGRFANRPYREIRTSCCIERGNPPYSPF